MDSGSSSRACLTEMHGTCFPDICISPGISDIQGSCALSELHSSSHASPHLAESITCEIPCQMSLGLSLSQCEASKGVETLNQSGKDEREAYMGSKTSGIDVNSEPVAMEVGDNERAVGKVTASGKVTSGVNDLFWEQFLTETPGSATDTQEAESKIQESRTKDQDERLPENGKCWSNKQTLDQLTEQMGHLQSGTQT